MIKVIKGDLFKNLPVTLENEITYIFHICNAQKQWGAGFVIPLERAFPGCKDSYKKHIDFLIKYNREPLGTCDFISFLDGIVVCNAVAQDNSGKRTKRLVNYAAMSASMKVLRDVILEDIKQGLSPRIICPRFAVGIGGGSQEVVDDFIEWHWGDLDVTIYEL